MTTEKNPYENLPVISNEEALEYISGVVLQKALARYGENNSNSRLKIDDRIAGAVYTTLNILQHGGETYYARMPSFSLIANIPDNLSVDSQKAPLVMVRRVSAQDKSWSNLDSEDLETFAWPREPIPLQGANEGGGTSISQAFATIYDKRRDTLAACARDLFNYGDDIE